MCIVMQTNTPTHAKFYLKISFELPSSPDALPCFSLYCNRTRGKHPSFIIIVYHLSLKDPISVSSLVRIKHEHPK